LQDSNAHQISEALHRGGEDALREAVSLLDPLCATLPPGDELARIIFNVAFHYEALCDDALCSTLYRRCLDCPVQDPNIHAGCWFRLGGCLERLRSWKRAIDCYREAIRLGVNWHHMTDQASLRLAELLAAAEDFEAAEALYDELRTSSIEEIRQPQVRLARAKCLVSLGRAKDAIAELDYTTQCGNAAEALAAERVLAEIHESAGDRKGAIACYQRILNHPAAESSTKAAANFRIASLR
jgi:tetratricopeptide (TPR) repeat protein